MYTLKTENGYTAKFTVDQVNGIVNADFNGCKKIYKISPMDKGVQDYFPIKSCILKRYNEVMDNIETDYRKKHFGKALTQMDCIKVFETFCSDFECLSLNRLQSLIEDIKL